MAMTQGFGDAETKRASQVTTQMKMLDDLMSAIEQNTKALQQHLSGVLRDEPPEPSPDKEQAEATLVPLAGNIRQVVNQAATINRALQSLNNRIEV